VDSAVRSLVLG